MESNRFGIPKADYFTENNNRYTGSCGSFRFCLDAGGDTLRASVWHGEKCLEKSEVEAEKEFSKDAEGFLAALQWLESQDAAAGAKN